MTPQFILKASLCREPRCENDYIKKNGGYKKYALDEIENMGWAEGYAEKGYDEAVKGILFANWNLFPPNIDMILEKAGYECEWSDEWDICSDCCMAVRISGNCYDWQPYSVVIQGERVCMNCLDRAEYLESIEDDYNKACMDEIDPSQHGYARISDEDEYENGWHQGQTDTPKEVLKALHENGKFRIVFRISETSQFYIKFETWQRIVELVEPEEDEDCDDERFLVSDRHCPQKETRRS